MCRVWQTIELVILFLPIRIFPAQPRFICALYQSLAFAKTRPHRPALSPPQEPIVFWIENTVPNEYREAIREGALMWNRAFAKSWFPGCDRGQANAR
jgi:hypothetical protein